MTDKRSQSLRRVYPIALSAILVITGICLMVQCLRIYTSPEGIFTPEIVAQAFKPIAIPCYLCLVMVIVGFFLPAESRKQMPEKNYGLILEKLHAKTDLDSCSEQLRSAVIQEQKRRRQLKYTTFFLMCTGVAEFLRYALAADAFHQHEINASMIQAMACLVPCVAFPLGCGIYAAYQSKASIRREIDLLKSANAPRTVPVEKPRKKKLSPALLRWAFLAVALAILVYGYVTGGTADVLTKAINICTECVGLG